MSAISSRAAATQPSSLAARRSRIDHLFYSTFSYVILASVLFGFSRTYYLKEFFDTPPLPLIFHVHAAVFTAWLVLLIVQTSLVSSHRTDLHKKLGWLGLVLAAAMVTFGYMAAVASSHSGHFQNGFAHDATEALFANGGDLVVFLAFLIPAFLLRRAPEIHKRLILLATTGGLLSAAIARWPILHRDPKEIVPVLALFVLAGPVYDLITRRRIHPAYVVGLIFLLLTPPPTRVALARTHFGQQIGAWILR